MPIVTAMKGLVTGAAIATLLGGCGTTHQAAAVSDSSPPGPCTAAPPGLVNLINSSFSGEAEHINGGQVVDGPDDRHYLSADIYDGDDVVADDAVWLFREAQLYTLSPDALSRSSLPDGRAFGSPDDEYGVASRRCVDHLR